MDSSDIVQQARDFAIKAHGNQRYGKMPYEYHLQQVVNKLIHWRDLGQWEITDEMIAAAWLHDVLEDTLVRHTDLYIEFGDEITMTCYLLNKHNCLPAKFDYIKYIDKIKADNSARLVKMADTLCNLEASILSGEMKRINKYSKQLTLLTEV